MATLRQQVGNLVRHHRRAAGLTQLDLAGRTGRSVEMINRIERGVAAPSFETLEKFSKILKTPVRDFFGTGPYAVNARRDDPLQKLLDRVAGLGPEDMKWVEVLVTHALRRKVRASL